MSRDADEAKIRKAYKVLALKYHPDKNSQSETQRAQAEKKFKEIKNKYYFNIFHWLITFLL